MKNAENAVEEPTAPERGGWDTTPSKGVHQRLRSCSDVELFGTLKGQQIRLQAPSSCDRVLAFTSFLLVGTVGLIGWNSLLNTLPSLRRVLFVQHGEFTDLMTALYFSSVGVVMIMCLFLHVERPGFVLAGITCVLGSCIGLLIVCRLLTDTRHTAIVFHVVAICLGCSAALVLSSGIGMAAQLPPSFVGAVATGMGLAGLITFSAWMIASRAIFGSEIDGIRDASTFLFSVSVLVCILAIFSFLRLYSKPWVRANVRHNRLLRRLAKHRARENKLPSTRQFDCPSLTTGSTEPNINSTAPRRRSFTTCRIAEINQQQDNKVVAPIDNYWDSNTFESRLSTSTSVSSTCGEQEQELELHGNDPLVSEPLRRPSSSSPPHESTWFEVLTLCGELLAVRLFVFFQTLLVFPTIGPVGWHTTLVGADILVGCYQLADFGARYLSNTIGFLTVKASRLKYYTLLRFGLVVSCYLIFIFDSSHFASHLATQAVLMLLLSVTNGILSTSATVHLPRCVSGQKAKAKASVIGIAISFVGIIAGQWSAKGLKAIILNSK